MIATGAVPEVPDMPGVDKPHVVSMFDVFTGKAELGKEVVILGGSGAAISLALFVIDKMERDGDEGITVYGYKFRPSAAATA